MLILWLDCDREGENICFDVMSVIQKINPNIEIRRAKFSTLTKSDLNEAINNLIDPNKYIADAVDVRQKIDLLSGSAFTILQSVSFKDLIKLDQVINSKNFNNVISYGPCQFPTLNFIVDRTEKIRNFIKEKFFYLELILNKGSEKEISFSWERNRLFDENITNAIYDKILNEKITVIKIEKNERKKIRPVPLNTIEMQKLISIHLKISSSITMKISENLYQKGYISYPRTETQRYSKTEIPKLRSLLKEFSDNKDSLYNFQEYSKTLSEKEFILPRIGKGDDKSHPPIHPLKFVKNELLFDKEKDIYEFIVRHFLATISPDAEGDETYIEIKVGDEIFKTTGFIFSQLGYLEIYPYGKAAEKTLPLLKLNEEFEQNKQNELHFKEGYTSPPYFMTEAELISLMDKNGIGTDSTIHEHIRNIEKRGYMIKTGNFLKPSLHGTALIKSYESINTPINKPYLRSQMEKNIRLICEQKEKAEVVYEDNHKEMLIIFDYVFKHIPEMKKFIQKYLDENKTYNKEIGIKGSNIAYESRCELTNINVECPQCKTNKLRINQNRSTKLYFLGCNGYPVCGYIFNLKNPNKILLCEDKCEDCDGDLCKLDFLQGPSWIMCFGKCLDEDVKNEPIKLSKKKKNEFLI